MLGAVFERFVENSPISVMVRGTLERVLGAEPLNRWYDRTALKQYTRDLLFSTVYDLMSQVVFRITPSLNAAYRDHEADVGSRATGAGTGCSRQLAPVSAPSHQAR